MFISQYSPKLRPLPYYIYRQALLEANKVFVNTATAVELHIVVTAKLGTDGILHLNRLLEQPLFEIVAVDQRQMHFANQAYERFSKIKL